MGRIDPETGGIWRDDDPPESEGEQGLYIPPPTRESPVPQLVADAMKGIMALSRPLKSLEPKKLSPIHIQMLMDRAMGMRPTEIAQKFDMEVSRVSVILNHPYAERILGAIFATLSDRVTDPIERMKGYAHEMIDTKLGIVRDKSTPKGLKNAIASDLLDRSGYGARRHVEISTPTAPSVPSEALARLTEAINEVRKAPATEYSRFVRNYSKNEGEEVQSMPPVAQEPGKTPVQTDGASPIGPLQQDSDERKTA